MNIIVYGGNKNTADAALTEFVLAKSCIVAGYIAKGKAIAGKRRKYRERKKDEKRKQNHHILNAKNIYNINAFVSASMKTFNILSSKRNFTNE